ncbi:restriction endonuclease subunit S [Clostridium perfringens]|nr:restriction endonuclease subunit S [Clostridium perfringens]MDM0660209.1 restriction endonuclease subunit S [Clostridium perfringens]
MKKEVREGYKMTELGEIPSGWDIVDLKEVLNLLKDGTHNPPNRVETGVVMLSAENIFNSKVNFGLNEKFISYDDYYKMHNNYEIEKGDILMTIVGTIGRTAIVECDYKFTVQRSVAILRSNEKINNYYLEKFLSSNICNKQLIKRSNSTAQAGLYLGELGKIKIILPSTKEQKKIAEILSTVDEQIENTEKLIQKNEDLKKGLMQQLLTKGIGHKEFKKTYLGDIPKEWHIINFFEFVNKIIDFRGRTPKKLGLNWGNGTILALSANNVKMGKIDFNLESYYASNELYEKWMGGNELSKGDLVMTMEAPLGNIAQIPNDEKYILSQRVVALKTNNNIDNEFMKYMLMSNNVQNQLDMLSTGTTAKGINQKNLSKVLIALPKIEEQRKIASILSVLDEKVEQYKYKKEKLEELKKGLMQNLLTGKLRVI